MDMIGQNNEVANEPTVRSLPRFNQEVVHSVVSEYWLAVPRAYG